MDSQVIGSGMLAKAFRHSKTNDCFFYCSGVSNSRENRLSEFEREKNLIIDSIEKYKNYCFVYFSSVLVGECNDMYYIHKNNMEEIIKDKSLHYRIIRLPQVVGVTNNNTLISYFTKKILSNSAIDLYIKAERNLIDVEDIVRIFDEIHQNEPLNKTDIFCSKYSINPLDLVRIISEDLGIVADLNILDKGVGQYCDFSFMDKVLDDFDILKSEFYARLVLEKYIKATAAQIN